MAFTKVTSTLADTLNQNTTGNAATATALASARTIGGTSFDGTGNIAVATATEATNVTVSANNSTDETVYPAFVDGATGTQGIETDTGLTYNPSTGDLTTAGQLGGATLSLSGNATVGGNLTVTGTTTQVNTVTMNAQNAVVFEGSTADNYETTLSIVDPTADHTQYLINQGGYIPVLAAVSTTAISATPAELNLLDGSTANSVVNSKALIYGSSGQVAATTIGVGVTSNIGNAKVHIKEAASGYSGSSSNNTELTIENDNNTGIQFLTPNNKSGGLWFGDPDAAERAKFYYSHASDLYVFNAAATNVLNIASTGLSIGTTTAGTAPLEIHDDSGGFSTSSVAASIASSAMHIQGDNDMRLIFTENGSTFRGMFGYEHAGSTYMGIWDNGSSTNPSLVSQGGKIGIGDTSPFTKLHVEDTSWSSGAPYGAVASFTGNNVNDNNWGHLIVTDSSTANGNGGSIRFGTGTADSSNLNPFAGIQGVAEGTSHGSLALYTRPSGGTATERMRISSIGNLFLNMTSGHHEASNRTVFEMSGTSSALIGFDINGTYSTYIFDSGTSGTLEINHPNEVYLNADSKLRFATGSNVEAMTIMSDGDVGIGTTAPAQKLHIFQTEGGVGAKHAALQFGGYAAYKDRGPMIAAYRVTGNSNDQGLIFSTYDATNAVVDTLTMTNAGNVGIGTTSPAGVLDIPSGSYSATKPAMMLGGDIDTAGAGSRTDNTRKYSSIVGYHYSNEEQPIGIIAYDCQSDSLAIVNYGIPSGNYNAPTVHRWHTSSNATTTAGTERMRIAGDGTVGIGTTDPSSFNANRNNLVISDSGASGITLNAGTSDGSFVSFTDGSGHLAGEILYYHASNYMVFKGSGSNTEHFRIASNGDLTATDTSIGSNSDSRLKKNIESYNYDINKFKNYAPKKFDWQNPEEHGNKSQQIGFIAQDLESIDSRWVGEIELQDDDGDGYDNPDLALVAADKIAKTSKFSEKDAMYISVIQQLITRIEALEG